MSLFATPGASIYPWPEPYSWGAQLLEQNPSAAFQREMERLGTAWGSDPYSQYARSLFGRSQDAYQAQAATSPGGLGATYVGFLQNEFPKIFQSAWTNLTPNQRGQSSAYPGVGRSRYVGF